MLITVSLVLALSAPVHPAADGAASKATLAEVRAVGTAMMAWWVDQITGVPKDSPSPERSEPTKVPEALDWSHCPVISPDALRALLVPDYIQDMPRHDGWGNDLEFCLEREDFSRTKLILGVRSPGRNGAFEGAGYLPGAFAAADFDADVVWLDGFFARWPESAAGQ